MDQFHSTAILIRVAIEAIFWFGDLRRGVLTWMPMSLYNVVARCFASDEKLPLGPFDRSAANQLQEPKIEISIDRIGWINRQLSGWILPPLMIRAFEAHSQAQTWKAAAFGRRWNSQF
jgi:hypothetical protein